MMWYALIVLLIGAALLFVLWSGTEKSFRLGGTFRAQCPVCKQVEEITDPYLHEARDFYEAFGKAHDACHAEGVGS